MTMSHNQMAYVAIVSTLIFGSLFVGASGYFQTSEELVVTKVNMRMTW